MLRVPQIAAVEIARVDRHVRVALGGRQLRRLSCGRAGGLFLRSLLALFALCGLLGLLRICLGRLGGLAAGQLHDLALLLDLAVLLRVRDGRQRRAREHHQQSHQQTQCLADLVHVISSYSHLMRF